MESELVPPTTGVEVADILKEYGSEYRKKYKTPERQTKIMNLITSCRTSALGVHIEKCEKCGYEKPAYNSCRNRHCPKCQYRAKEKWLEKRKSELLPVSYYHIVFTIPCELNRLALMNKKTVYDILFRSASETLLQLSRDTKHTGAETGILAILHTWGQNLTDHPHLHCVVPKGGYSEEKKKWIYPKKAKYRDFFIHVRVISRLFKNKFLYYLKEAYKNGRLETKQDFWKLIDKMYEKEWVTYCKRPFGNPARVIEYLGRYTHKTAISNNRIKRIENGKVVFGWKDYRDGGKKKEMALEPVEFIRRFMLHILPEGFFKIRYYGILSSRKKKKILEECLEIFRNKKAKRKLKFSLPEKKEWMCPECKEGRMTFVRIPIRASPE